MKKKDSDEKTKLLDADGNYCGHKNKGWFHHEFICGDCGLIFEKNLVRKDEPGYDFRNHIMRSTNKK